MIELIEVESSESLLCIVSELLVWLLIARVSQANMNMLCTSLALAIGSHEIVVKGAAGA